MAQNIHCCLFVLVFLIFHSHEKFGMFAAVLPHTEIQQCKHLSLNPFPKMQLQMAFLSSICNSSIFVIPEATSVHTIFRLCFKHKHGTIPQLSISNQKNTAHLSTRLKNQVKLQKQKPFLILHPLHYV